MTTPGISGFALYVPRPRVWLERWCEWTDTPWPKIEAIVGRSFRMCGPGENVYTMRVGGIGRQFGPGST